jgi:hypothetical protein
VNLCSRKKDKNYEGRSEGVSGPVCASAVDEAARPGTLQEERL